MIRQCCLKDCPQRHPGCHDSCRKYQDWKQEYKKEKAYTKDREYAGKIDRNDYDKEGWMAHKGQRKRRKR